MNATLKCALLAGIAIGLNGRLAAMDFHVATTGDDANPGTAERPFRTLVHARDAVRTYKTGAAAPGQAITVWIHAGTHELLTPLEFTKDDSGTETAPVVYRAVDGADVWLTGGQAIPLSAFAPVTDDTVQARLPPESRTQVRQVSLKAIGITERPAPWPDTWWVLNKAPASLCELFADGERLPLARWPNDDYTRFGDIVEPANEEGQLGKFKYLGDRPARWLVDKGVWLYGYWRRGYRAEFVRVKAIDTAAQTIELAARNSLGNLEPGGACRYMAVNLLEELDCAGEWFIDWDAATLYLWPPATLRTPQVVLSMNERAIIACKDASFLEFRGLGIECSRCDGITIQGGSHCRVAACEVRNVARTGVALRGTAHTLVGCDIHDTGDKGLVLDSGDRFTLTPGGSVADNNHIHHVNRIVRAGSSAASIGGVGNRFSHNLVHDTGYIAVMFGGNDHVLEYNRLFRTNTETAEGGVFYTGRDWTSRGSIIRWNFIHHVDDTREGCGSSTRFVHLDDSAPGIEIYGNVCYRMGGGVSICGGAENNVHDNLFVECNWGVDIGPRGQDMFKSDGKGGFEINPNRWNWDSLAKLLVRYKWNQPPYSTRYPKLVEIFQKDPIAAPWFNVVTRNLMVACGRGICENGMQPGWSTVENNWEGDDPGFVEPDHTRLDFRLKPDAPVLGIGFQALPFEKIGLYASADRRSWPVAHELPATDWMPRWMHLRAEKQKVNTALPTFKVMPATVNIVVDGVVDPMEWTPGDATGRNPEVHATAYLEWTATGQKAKRPSQALLETDASNLYVAFASETDPATGVSGGHRWGADDAVEVAIAQMAAPNAGAKGKLGDIIVLRGYADGTWESSGEAGAPADVVARAKQGVEYAAKVKDKTTWSAEWKIPFAALGIDPAKGCPTLLFNLSVRKPAGDEWVTWKKSAGGSWDVSASGFLWLTQLGQMPSAAAK